MGRLHDKEEQMKSSRTSALVTGVVLPLTETCLHRSNCPHAELAKLSFYVVLAELWVKLCFCVLSA